MLNLQRVARQDHGHGIGFRNPLAGLALFSIVALGLAAGCDSNGSPKASGASNAATPKVATTNNTTPAVTDVVSTTPPAQLAGHVQGTPNDSSVAHQAAANGVPPGPPPGPDMIPPPIRFEPESLDFGLMTPGQGKTGVVQIRNLSDKALRIVGSRSSCKCTAVDLANTIIEPGQTVPLTATMKPDVSPGPKKAQVRVAFEGFGQIVSVDIHGEVSLAVHCDPAYLTATEGLSGEIEVNSLDDKPFHLITANRQPPDFVDFDPAKDEIRSHYKIRWDLTKYDPENCDEWPGWFVLETDHPNAPIIDLRIRHKCTIPKRPGGRRWLPLQQRELLGLLKPGQVSEITIPMLWAPGAAENDLVNAVVTKSKDFTVELLATDYTIKEPEIRVRITPNPDVRGVLYGVIELNSILGNEADYTIIGRVAE